MRRIWLIAVSVVLSAATFAAASADSPLQDIRADFELQDRNGEFVRDEEFLGKNVLLAFGFTHCVHVCPMIAANMASTLRVTDKDAVGIFVSVDTERDSPATTDDYAGGFGPTMIGLSGSYSQVSAAAKNFNATFVVTKSQDNYTVQHTPGIFLIGPDGAVIDVFAMNTAPGVIAAAMK